MAGAASLAAVAINVLVKDWDQLAAFGQSRVKTQAEEMEELRKKTSLTADEADRLARASALPDKVKELHSGKTEEQKKTEEAVGRAITEAGAGNVAQGILSTDPSLVDASGEAAAAKAKLEALQKKLETTEKLHSSDTTGSTFFEAARLEKEIDAAKLELRGARERTATQVAASAARGDLFPGGLDRLRGLVDRRPEAFGPGGAALAARLREASPEGRADAAAKADADADRDARGKDAKRVDASWSADEDVAGSEAQARLDPARTALAEAMEKDPYATGKVAAEAEFQAALDAQLKAHEDSAKRREDSTGKEGYLTEQEQEGRRRAERARDVAAKAAQERGQKEIKEVDQKRARDAGGGVSDRYRTEVLRDIALGKDTDRGALQGKVAADLQRTGNYSAQDAKKFSETIVDDLLKDAKKTVQGRGNEEGVDPRTAAYQELAKETSESQKGEGSSRFSDFSSFYKSLQQGADADPYQRSIDKNTRETAAANRALLAEVLRRRGEGGGLAGAP